MLPAGSCPTEVAVVECDDMSQGVVDILWLWGQAEVQAVNVDNSIYLHTRSVKYGKVQEQDSSLNSNSMMPPSSGGRRS